MRGAASASALRLGGITGFSATDFPGKLATVIFVQGCPWRCGYCHNPHLQERGLGSALTWDEIMCLLKRRVGLIDAVVFSGGEPCIDPALYAAMWEVKALGFSIGMHTACIYPRQLQAVLPLLDWVGFDVKHDFDHYQSVTTIRDSGRAARQCVELILASGVAYECRTTIHPILHDDSTLLNLAHGLQGMGVKNYVLQKFRSQGCSDPRYNTNGIEDYPQAQTITMISHMFREFAYKANAIEL